MTLNFEWNEEKARANVKKHSISFVEAATVFSDPFSVIIDDPLHSTEEYRFIAIGYSDRQRLLVVVYTEREDNIRIISARVATSRERRTYEQGN
ncbi:BrnT family toxin [Argonema antarcticum]|uniref:BrnT family toxin n=1 Tax=Argonema antarcticum TaxID=2942763 RepID=UPI00201226F4|nr:BrnT family toxin [Argonema antarcticum]MCL1473085.1 BrnT family toxin [Argonema antarcticum A004/B2]